MLSAIITGSVKYNFTPNLGFELNNQTTIPIGQSNSVANRRYRHWKCHLQVLAIIEKE